MIDAYSINFLFRQQYVYLKPGLRLRPETLFTSGPLSRGYLSLHQFSYKGPSTPKSGISTAF